MDVDPFPKSQGQLIRAARGLRTQGEFARLLNVDRSCLSRYESERLGAPPRVINYCLAAVAKDLRVKGVDWQLDDVLRDARAVVTTLERLSNEKR